MQNVKRMGEPEQTESMQWTVRVKAQCTVTVLLHMKQKIKKHPVSTLLL